MFRSLKVFVGLFGVTCCVIAAAHVAFGPKAIVGSMPVNAALDSEDRFFATLFLGFGAALVWCSRDLLARRGIFCALLLTFAAGGVARVVSIGAVGWPHPFHVVLAGVELVLPVVLWAWLRRAETAARPKDGTSI